MTNIYSKEDLRIIYQSLPENLQDVILAPETIDQYIAVAKKFGLTDLQRKELGIQSGLLLMGITQPQQFIIALTEKLALPKEKTTLITQDLNRDIFNAVKDSLKEVHKHVETLSVKEEVQPVVSVPTPTSIAPVIIAPPATQPSSANAIEAPAENTPSVFEQKLSGTFRINADGGTPITTPNPKHATGVSTPSASIMFTPPTPPSV